MPESTTASEADSGAYHQIHFAWAEPTLLGRVGPGPSATSLPEQDQPVLRSWRDRLIPALTADYRSALPGTDPAAYPETLWAHHYPDGQSALVYRWPGDVRDAHAWAIVGPTRGLDLPRVLALHENPNTRPAASRPPKPGWAAMRTLPAPAPWERTAAPGALRTRDRRAAETRIEGEPVLVGAVAHALAHPDRPLRLTLDPDHADLWQATQLRFLWGMHRVLHDVLTPRAAVPAAGWSWSFSTYEPVTDPEDGPHLAFVPPSSAAGSPFLSPVPGEHLRIAEGLVAVLREEGGDALADHLRERGVPEATTFGERRDLLRDWLDPAPAPLVEEPVAVQEASAELAGESAPTERGTPSFFAPSPPTGIDLTPDSRADTPAPDPLTDEAVPEPEDDLEEAPDPFADDDTDTAEQETWAGGGRSHTFLGVARRRPAPEPEHDPLSIFGRPPRPAAPEDPSTEPDPPVSRDEAARSTAADEEPRETWTIAASTDRPEPRAPEDAPPLAVRPLPEQEPVDYAAETEPETDENLDDPDDNWPTQYADLPLARLERWHSKRGPEGAHVDVVDARAAVRAERAELQRVRDERDRYHTEVQDLRREIARLDQSWIDAEPFPETPEHKRRWPLVLLVTALAVTALVIGLEVGSGTRLGVLDLLGRLTPWG
ncbi:hypothetical protein [Nocardiopsis eucommiae]|uniref:hypothetical protein n=1 Tax=Nocardiopsis eucommiae TaxID=2831970 RepID=UPI003D72889B